MRRRFAPMTERTAFFFFFAVFLLRKMKWIATINTGFYNAGSNLSFQASDEIPNFCADSPKEFSDETRIP